MRSMSSTGGQHSAMSLIACPPSAGPSRAAKHLFPQFRHSHASLWIKDGGDPITLSKRLGHSTPQVTMTTYADEIEEVNDSTVRKAHVEALFGGTKLAALMAATDGGRRPQTRGAGTRTSFTFLNVATKGSRAPRRWANHQVVAGRVSSGAGRGPRCGDSPSRRQGAPLCDPAPVPQPPLGPRRADRAPPPVAGEAERDTSGHGCRALRSLPSPAGRSDHARQLVLAL